MGNERVDARGRFDFWADTGLYETLQLVSFGRSGARLRARLVDALALRAGSSVLDVATGTGLMLPLLAEAVGPSGRVVGVDLSTAMVRRAERRRARHPQLDLRACDAAALPFADGEFDAVTSSYGLSCIADVEPVLDEIGRVLRPGGALGVAEAATLNWRPAVLARVVTRALSPFNAWYPERDLGALLERRGYALRSAATGRGALSVTVATRTASS
jgi:ubiquinone/menaquinone biosynthesis C-methylase UbiE